MTTEMPGRRGRWGRNPTRGPNGRWNCHCGCGREVVPPRRTTFSKECVDAWMARNDPKTIRGIILKRDQAICRGCQMDCRSSEEFFASMAATYSGDICQELLMLVTGWRKFRPGDESARWWTYDKEAIAAEEQQRLFYADSWAERSYLIEQRDRDLQARGFVITQSLWEADHIVPVIEGGGQCGPEGYRTLCQLCHRVETAALARRRAAKRRQATQPELKL